MLLISDRILRHHIGSVGLFQWKRETRWQSEVFELADISVTLLSSGVLSQKLIEANISAQISTPLVKIKNGGHPCRETGDNLNIKV